MARKLSRADVLALEAFRDEATELKGDRANLGARAAELHFDAGVPRDVIAEYTSMTRSELAALLKPHANHDWVIFKQANHFHGGSAGSNDDDAPFGFRLRREWTEANMTCDQLRKTEPLFYLLDDVKDINEAIIAVLDRLGWPPVRNYGLFTLGSYYDREREYNPYFYLPALCAWSRLWHLWRRLGSLDDATMDDIFKPSPGHHLHHPDCLCGDRRLDKTRCPGPLVLQWQRNRATGRY